MFIRKRILVLAGLALLLSATGASGAPHVHLKYATFDLSAGEPQIPAELRAHAVSREYAYYIVQFNGPIEPSWKADLGSLGAEIFDYLPDFAFIVRMTPEAAENVSRLPEVQGVAFYHPAYRLSPGLMSKHGSFKVVIQMFPGESRLPVEAEIRRAGGSVHASASGPGGEHVEASLTPQMVRRIAVQRGVYWIEPRLERRLSNNVARGIMNVPPVWTNIGLFGSGELVAVCDTGLDTGSLSTISADFAGRIFRTYALGRKNKWDDPHGHGTHVAGSVLGSGALSGANPATHNYTSSFAGNAPEAQLVFQSVLDNAGGLGGIPSNLNDLFLPPYSDDGARVHTNSWGAAYAGAYTTDSRNLDMFMWNHKDMTILFSAGNGGVDANADGVVDLDSLDSPGTAKNCITIGANENYRLSGGAQGTYWNYWPDDYPAEPIKSDKVSNNSSGMVAFSSRGPCDDGRIKPDICAPGTNIISCRSHVAGAGTLWGVYNADYVYCGGTSMSTPLTAGACALVREYYRTTKSHTPSAALIKATLINGAAELYPGQYGTGSFKEIPTTRPNNVEGWGLVNLAYNLTPTAPRTMEFADNTAGLNTGGSAVYTYPISASTDPLRITLVWTDYWASVSASPALVNDLDLVVTLPDSSTRRGNGTTDRLNNVEGVDINSPMPGTYTVTISGYNIPDGPQAFALVVSGDIGPPPPTAVIDLPAAGTTLFGPVRIKGTASGSAFQEYTLEYGIGESPSSWSPIGVPQTTPVVNGVLGTWDTSALSNGTYTVKLTARNTEGGVAADTVTVNVLKTSIYQVKNSEDGDSVILTGKVVSAGPAQFPGIMYVQEPDRSSGLKVELGSTQTDAIIGSIVTVSGTLQTLAGERTITNPVVTVTGSGDQPTALSVVNRDVGGSALNIYTPGVTGGTGLNNVGLLICVWGRVTAVGSDYFYLDDGSNLAGASGYTGLKVITGVLSKPGSDQYAAVVGISSVEVDGSTIRPVVRPRRGSDLTYY
ncbi:MAG TPA: S8 family serine peptidase [Armatimonadota bacterium]|nr:S8 family serine peptidase [Armatimonadota bacterium]